MRTALKIPTLWLLALALALSIAQCVRADTDTRLAQYVATLVAQQDSRVSEALARIDGDGRRLLALRSYIRSARDIDERWSWTEQQIAAYEGSQEQRDLQREIERVRTVFVAGNPGFELYVNPRVRSLDIQIAQWNTNRSVASASAALLAAAQLLIVSPGFTTADKASARLRVFLSEYNPRPTPTIAAPGLSRHGQMRDIDFQVHQRGRVVAGPNTATIATDWETGGWAAKLDAAVRAAGNRFTGPLASPSEPWHYTYTPAPATAQ